ncbi:MAG TPA: DHH family phosphoesterase [Lachnospiraceae bacterium]|nr:DHH family phosphoesterase [Lachnospiraceae bacterium]
MNNLKITGQLKSYLRWPMVLSVLWAVMTVAVFAAAGRRAGIIALIFLIIYAAISFFMYNARTPKLMNELVSFATQYGQVQKNLLKEFVLPYALLDGSGSILWMNNEFAALSGKDLSFHKNIAVIFPEIKKGDLPGTEQRTECEVLKNEKRYRAAMQKVVFTELMTGEEELNGASDDYIIALYLFDETELGQLIDERDKNKLVCGLLSLDNYEEAMESIEEVRRSLLLALVDRKINKFFTEVDGIVRKTEKDKYFFVIRKKALEELENGHFSLLDDVKTVNIGNEMSITISIGIGFGSNSFLQNAESARVAIELALGRGGDQVVIKDGYNTRYFGGKTESMEKNTRVKARVKAHALKEILSSKEEVVIMGHKITDVDSLGAAVGIFRAAQTIGKPAHIVIDSPPDALRPLMDVFLQSSDYTDRMFINTREAKEMTNANTAVVVVDTNKPDYTECEELLHRSNTVVVLDHHRQGRDIIQNAVLSYIEPYASSACEMVAEVLQYFDDKLKIRSTEADSLYAGIMIDTNNFLTRTGVRTFEAAAYLRRSGADVTRIRKMFRDSMEDCRAKASAIANAEIYHTAFAISEVKSAGLKSPTVVCAQAANELLSVVGIKASFVLTDYNHTIYISARAIDEVNVQLIMERLGGGGHLNIAGAQLTNSTIPAAIELLKSTITQMKEEGDL